ncbi:MAG: hypothetical protein U0U66_08860 [Cytophagaceae bacterium]
MNLLFKYLCIPIFLASSAISYAQTDTTTKKPKFYILETDTVPNLLLKPDTTNKKKNKKVKVKKNTFYGYKCKKAFVKTLNGQSVIIETFYVLKEWKDPSPYLQNVYVWDMMNGVVKKMDKKEVANQPQYRILHGPYKKEVNGNITEIGAFYIGGKHARWELYDKNFTLTDKTKYYKGWPKEAKISYYDNEQTKIKEVIPYEYGLLQGDYYLFTEDGNILTKGQYDNGAKVGVWVDYFPNTTKRQRETKYPDTAYDKDTPPVVQKEWDEKGRVIIVNGEKVDPNSKDVKDDPIKNRLKRKR